MFSTEVTWSPIHPWSCLEVPLHLLDSTPAVRVISHNQVTEHPVDNGMPRNQTGWVDVGKDGAVENPREPRERSLRGWYEETNDKKTLVLTHSENFSPCRCSRLYLAYTEHDHKKTQSATMQSSSGEGHGKTDLESSMWAAKPPGRKILWCSTSYLFLPTYGFISRKDSPSTLSIFRCWSLSSTQVYQNGKKYFWQYASWMCLTITWKKDVANWVCS